MRHLKKPLLELEKQKLRKRNRVLDYKKITMLTMRFLNRLDFCPLPGPIIEPVFSFSCGKLAGRKLINVPNFIILKWATCCYI